MNGLALSHLAHPVVPQSSETCIKVCALSVLELVGVVYLRCAQLANARVLGNLTDNISSPEEVQEFCVWRNAPMCVLSCRRPGGQLRSDAGGAPHCVLPGNMCRAVKRVLERQTEDPELRPRSRARRAPSRGAALGDTFPNEVCHHFGAFLLWPEVGDSKCIGHCPITWFFQPFWGQQCFCCATTLGPPCSATIW